MDMGPADARQRALTFSRYVGLELKGKITARGFTAKDVAMASGHSAAAFNRWLNGRVELPLTVLCEACEIIGIEPRFVVDVAYDRLIVEYRGPGEAVPRAAPGVGGQQDTEAVRLAAKRGRRKVDIEPAE